jgi:hypothetical protein
MAGMTIDLSYGATATYFSKKRLQEVKQDDARFPLAVLKRK